MKKPLQYLNLVPKILPLDPQDVFYTEMELFLLDTEKTLPPIVEYGFDYEHLAYGLLLPYVIPSESTSSADGVPRALELLAFTGLDLTKLDLVKVHEGEEWLPPAGYSPFIAGTGGPIRAACLLLRWYAALAAESPAAVRQFTHKTTAGPLITICPDFEDEDAHPYPEINFWLPAPVLQAMGYALVKNHETGPKVLKNLRIRDAILAEEVA